MELILHVCGVSLTDAKDNFVFIETGTYKGETVQSVAPLFRKAYSIELCANLAKDIQAVAFPDNVEIIMGDSLDILPALSTQLVGCPIVFFLDAHQSGTDTTNNGKWVPLLDEIGIVMERYSAQIVLVINDVRLFDKYWDWKGITTDTIDALIQAKGREILYRFTKNDRYILLIQ